MAKLYRYELAMKTKHWIPVGVLGVLGKSRWQTTLRLSFTRKITTCGSKLQAIETPKILYIKNKLLILSGTFKKKKISAVACRFGILHVTTKAMLVLAFC